eukprot:CAMPEP_0203668120 /NCGR_PEP_ID=MMETSP0090-20130426/4824_1 /ASSEMBLY_ACC=CAM_ASM_001088 /TAXON_ID=426623 /ORGANISM="Chaetoceros affinis, Strain CCMP159" /LENGTH=625 /DNA_ID=CAMNT_0050532475 /DNA_START=69 /DNA_END=1946 /DNA_ORIENTATION=+
MKINCEHRAISSWREIDRLANSCSLSSSSNNSHDENSSDISLSLTLLYGSWNTPLIGRSDTQANITSNEEKEAMEVHRKTIMSWLSSIITKGPSCIASALSSPNNDGTSTRKIPSTNEVLSIKVDKDDETMDICIGDYASYPSLVNTANNRDSDNDVIMASDDNSNDISNKLPGLQVPEALPALTLVIKSKNSHQPQTIPIDFNHVDLMNCLLGAANTNNNGISCSSTNNLKLNSLFEVIRGHISSSINTIREQQPALSKQKNRVDVNGLSKISSTNGSKNQSQAQSHNHHHPQLRIFIAGDKSQVGKSSICLGLIGTLIKKHKYQPSKIAYIKPATQCEESQLIAKYCEENNIANQPIGPIVYFKGFTRAFLNGDTDDSETLLQNAKRAVDEIALGKDVVIIDGVGYPAVGSICGTDNVSVASACGYEVDGTTETGDSSASVTVPPAVLIVGKRGVGDAIDSYNLNASYFKARGVKVMGAIFNRLPNDPNHFYSLESCKKAVSSYFENANRSLKSENKGEVVFGFIPEVEGLSSNSLEGADQFIDIFSNHVDVSRIIECATAMRQDPLTNVKSTSTISTNSNKDIDHSVHVRKKVKVSPSSTPSFKLTREQIESVAKAQGAAGG